MGKPIYTFQFTYDAAGELTSATSPDSSYAYTYDLLGRQTTVDNRGTPGVPEVTLSYTFDSRGKYAVRQRYHQRDRGRNRRPDV